MRPDSKRRLEGSQAWKAWTRETDPYPDDWSGQRLTSKRWAPPVRGENEGQKEARKYRWASVRQAERAALSRLEEPEPTRTRHQVLWDIH